METTRSTGEIYSDQDFITEWIAELDNTVFVLREGTELDKSEISQNALALYCESVFRLNRGLGMIVPLGQLPDEAEFSIAITQTVGYIIEASKRVETLRSLMNRRLIDTDNVVSYATKHARSWNGIAVKIFQVFIHMGEAVSFRRLLEVVHMMGYDPDFVAMQLEIEFERIALELPEKIPARTDGTALAVNADGKNRQYTKRDLRELTMLGDTQINTYLKQFDMTPFPGGRPKKDNPHSIPAGDVITFLKKLIKDTNATEFVKNRCEKALIDIQKP